MAMIMKQRILCIATALMCALYGYAQRIGDLSSKSTLEDAKEYFTVNLSQLEGIEGIYDVSMVPKFYGGNLAVGIRHWGGHEYSGTAFIWKESDGNMALWFAESQFPSIGPRMDLTPLGSTGAYRITGWYNEHYSHFHNSGTLSFEISSRVVYDKIGFSLKFGDNDEFHGVDMEMSFVKTFPNATMAEKKQQEKAVPKEWSGSGFALKEGYVVTNYHVIENAKTINVQGVNGAFNKKYSTRVIATDKVNDIALLKLDGVVPVNIPYSVKTTTSDVGEDVWVLGYPLTSTMGDEIKLTTGVVSAKSGFEGDVSLYQISAPIQPGNSGGPVFDGKGNLIGIVCAHHRGAENVGYAIKASYLRNLVESVVNHDIFPQANKLGALQLSNKVKAVKNYVYFITCSSSTVGGVSTNTASSGYTHSYPSIIETDGGKLAVTSVKVSPYETVLTLTSTNNLYGGWMNISKDAYIVANGIHYKLTGVEGIAYAPQKTLFSYQGETKQFKLHFQAIPQDTATIDFIESPSSPWKIYGIRLL